MIDYSLIFGADDYDPCEALKQLRPVYMQLLTTQEAQKIHFRERETWFYATDLKVFGNLINQLEADCAAKNGRRVRFAMGSGASR